MGLYLQINIALFLFCTLVVIVAFYLLKSKISQFNANSKIQFNYFLFFTCLIMLVISYVVIRNYENSFNNLYFDIGNDAKFSGTVIGIEENDKYYNKYIVSINVINNSSKFRNTNIILKTKRASLKLEIGDLITGIGDFEKPSIRKNFKGFDYSQYLKQKSIYMICKSDANNIKINQKRSLPLYKLWIISFKNKIKINLYKVLPKENADIANAFLLGDSKYIEKQQKEIFSDASLSHILAISGMHVGFVIGITSLLLKKFDKRKGKYLLIIILVFFMELTGGSPSVIRAVIMSGFSIYSKLVYRKSDTINNIAISCLIILIINPYNILNIGFLLSFLGTLGIVLFYNRINSFFYNLNSVNKIVNKNNLDNQIILNNQKNKRTQYIYIIFNKIIMLLISAISISVSANILIFPVLLYLFNVISFIFLLSNILVIPILSIMSFTGYLSAVLSLISINLSKIIAVIFNYCITIFINIAVFCSKFTFLRFNIITPNLFFIFIYYFLIIYFFFFYKKNHKKFLKLVFVLTSIILISINIFSHFTQGLKLYFIDVGQGDSTLIITQENKKILIDGGGSEASSFDVGENVLVPYLLDRNIMTIDFMIFSHFDSDHCKGLFTVMEKLKVKNAIISEQGEISENYKIFLSLVKAQNIKVISVKARL